MNPAAAGLFTYGIGPAFGIPTATSDRLGTGKWSAGPSVVVIALPGKWVVGVLASNTWSFAGDDDRADVNFFFSQFFVTYAIKNGWYLTSVPIITANWEAEGEKWTVPFGGGGGKLLKLGKLPVDVQIQAFWNAVTSTVRDNEIPGNDGAAADWSLRFQFKMLFPK